MPIKINCDKIIEEKYVKENVTCGALKLHPDGENSVKCSRVKFFQ